MFLEEIRLQNFRCFESLTIPLHRHLNVFVGGNGAGKTAILDTVALLLAPVLARLPFQKKPKLRSLVATDIRLVKEEIFSPFALLQARSRADKQQLTWDRHRLRDKSPTTKLELPPRKDLKELHQYVDGIIDARNQEKAYRLPVFAYYGTNRAVSIPHRRLRVSRLLTHIEKIGHLAGLEKSLSSDTNFISMVTWFNLLEIQELRAKRDKIIKQEQSLPALECVRQAITSLLPDLQNPRIDSRSGLFTVDKRDSSGRAIRLNLDQLSDGYQVMLGVVMDFALRLALTSPPDATWEDVLKTEAILLIDEVDLHLHPSWQQRVLVDLRRTFPNTQLIVTTHSPQVATTVPSQNLRIIKDSKLYSAPAGTEGAEAQRLLEDVFGVHSRPDTEHARQLDEYLKLVNERKWASDRAIELRKRLDEWSQGQEPMLLQADLQIENMKWEDQLENVA